MSRRSIRQNRQSEAPAEEKVKPAPAKAPAKKKAPAKPRAKTIRKKAAKSE
jgi:hypothetical protein